MNFADLWAALSALDGHRVKKVATASVHFRAKWCILKEEPQL